MPTLAERNLTTEARAVEGGHRALVVEGGAIQVVSDTTAGKRYRIEFHPIAAEGPIVFTCTPTTGPNLYRSDHKRTSSPVAGQLPCQHAAVAARRLEREGLAYLRADGAWCTTLTSEDDGPADPFEGLC